MKCVLVFAFAVLAVASAQVLVHPGYYGAVPAVHAVHAAPYVAAPYVAAPVVAAAPAPGYVAATRGSVHVAPLPGHATYASHHLNLAPAPGTI